MKQTVCAWALCLTALLFAVAGLADELPDGVEVQRLDLPAPAQEETVQAETAQQEAVQQAGEIPEFPVAPPVQTFEDPGADNAPPAQARAAAPQTGDGVTWLALSGMGLSALALAIARRLRDT